MKAFANSKFWESTQAQQAFGPLSPSAAFYATEGVFPGISKDFDEFWTPASEFRWPGNVQAGCSHGVFFPNKWISERCKKKHLHLHSEHPFYYGTWESLKAQKNHMRLCHPSILGPFRFQEALESCSLQSIWTSRRNWSWWFWLGRSQRNLCRSTCLVALLSRHFGGFFEATSLLLCRCWSPKYFPDGEVSWPAWSSWQNLGRTRKLPQKSTSFFPLEHHCASG